jgi:hypothetical protein
MPAGAHELLPVVARIKPQSVAAAATANSDAVDMSKFEEVLFIFNMGDYAAGNDGSVAVKVTADTASGGAFATDVTGKTLTAGSFTGSALDDAVGIIRVKAVELAAQGETLRYCRLEVTPADQDLTCAAIALGVHLGYSDAAELDLAKVKEIIA